VDRRQPPPRKRLLKSGEVLLGKHPVPCTIRNMSERGACLQVQTTAGIPAIFDFLRAGEPEARTCKTIRTAFALGVASSLYAEVGRPSAYPWRSPAWHRPGSTDWPAPRVPRWARKSPSKGISPVPGASLRGRVNHCHEMRQTSRCLDSRITQFGHNFRMRCCGGVSVGGCYHD